MSEVERKYIVEKETMMHLYKTGIIKSKKYSKNEIEEKRKFYLSLTPEKGTDIPLRRWHYEIKRVFELCKDFDECPDKWFYHLDTYRKYGI